MVSLRPFGEPTVLHPNLHRVLDGSGLSGLLGNIRALGTSVTETSNLHVARETTHKAGVCQTLHC